MRLKYLAKHVDERFVTPEMDLMSVSKTKGVIPRSEISDTDGRAEDISHYKTCQPGDLVINRMSAYQGALGIAKQAGAVSPDYMVLRFGPKFAPAFAGYFFKSHQTISLMSSLVKGIGSVDSGSVRTPRLSWTDLGNSPVSIPSVQEQVAIAGFLDRESAQIDALIEKQQQLVKALEERRNALILKSVTNGLDVDAEYQSLDSLWLSRVPIHWAVGSLKWYARLQTGGTPRGVEAEAEGPYPWLRPDDLNELGNPSIATRYIDQDGASQLNIAQSGATLICCIGGSLGKSGQVIEPAYFNQQITSVTWNMNPRYLYFLISGLKEAIRSLSVGNTLPILNNEKLGGLQIVVPPIDEQELICKYIESKLQKIDGLIQAARDTVNLLKERRQALISAAVTGKIYVRGN